MKNSGKKVLLSLTTTMLLASSVGHAQNFNYKDFKNCTSYNNYTINRYAIDCNYSNRYLNKKIVKYIPIDESWSNGWSWNNNTNKPINPETPKIEEKTDINIDNKENIKPDTNTTDATSVEMEVAKLVNIERQKEGLAPLTFSEELSKVARLKCQDMANNNYFSHNSPTYGDPFTMMKSFGIQYKTAGENIAKGYSSAQSVVQEWMNSSGHRANILNPSFEKIGVGYVNVNGTTYWTQMFTN